MNKHIADLAAVIMLSLAMGACTADETDAGSLEISLKAKEKVTARDVGLPVYPGAKEYKEPGNSSAGGNVGLSTPLFGLQIAALNMESADNPRKVAAFYKRELAKYGPVLDCSDDGRGSGSRSDARQGDELVCEGDERGDHDAVYKVGTKNKQRIVAIKPHESGARFSLVYLDIRKDPK